MRSYIHESNLEDIITARRNELALTQQDLANRLGYENVSFISMLERGKAKVPVEKMVEIAEALEIEPIWFIEKVMRKRLPRAAEEIFDKHELRRKEKKTAA